MPWLLLTWSGSILAQEVDLTKLPGYVDLGMIRIPEHAAEVTDIDFGPALLRLAGLVQINDEDEELGKILSGLMSIRVKSFEIRPDETENIRSIMEEIDQKLTHDAWESLVRVKGETQLTNISIMFDKNKIVGFFLMSLEGGESATFANIVGVNIDLDSIRKIGMGLEDLDMDGIFERF